jgi:hypothetical protein
VYIADRDLFDLIFYVPFDRNKDFDKFNDNHIKYEDDEKNKIYLNNLVKVISLAMREYGDNIENIENLLDFINEHHELRILYVFDGCDIFVNRSNISSFDSNSKQMSYKNVLQKSTVDNSITSNVNHNFKELIDSILRRSENVTILNLSSKGSLLGLLSHEHEKNVILPSLSDSDSMEFLMKLISPKIGIELFESDMSSAQLRYMNIHVSGYFYSICGNICLYKSYFDV